MRTMNPALNESTFEKSAQQWAPPSGDPAVLDSSQRMTFGGTLTATAVLLVLLLATATFGWLSVDQPAGDLEGVSIPGWIWAPFIGAIIAAIATMVKPAWSRVTAPLFALSEGFVLGAISALYNSAFDGIVLQAVGLTVAVLAIMVFLYATRIIEVTDKLRMGISAATGAVALIYVVSIVVNLFGGQVPLIHDNGLVGIGFSLVVVGVAAFNLLLDFDLIENGIKMGAPPYMEWFASFGLVLTLVWLYLEMLRLLAKLRSR